MHRGLVPKSAILVFGEGESFFAACIITDQQTAFADLLNEGFRSRISDVHYQLSNKFGVKLRIVAC